jgi:tRNA(Arg) A34 adenosine deaminase TadA
MSETEFMQRAIALSAENLAANGGPFGAVVVRDGRIIGEGANRVVPALDPTAHAEVVAIRAACQTIGSHSLESATIYTTCEPCPMCLSAIWWARISQIVYGNSREDAALIGFDDAEIYKEVSRPFEARKLPVRRFMAQEAGEIFKAWLEKTDRVPY